MQDLVGIITIAIACTNEAVAINCARHWMRGGRLKPLTEREQRLPSVVVLAGGQYVQAMRQTGSSLLFFEHSFGLHDALRPVTQLRVFKDDPVHNVRKLIKGVGAIASVLFSSHMDDLFFI